MPYKAALVLCLRGMHLLIGSFVCPLFLVSVHGILPVHGRKLNVLCTVGHGQRGRKPQGAREKGREVPLLYGFFGNGKSVHPLPETKTGHAPFSGVRSAVRAVFSHPMIRRHDDAVTGRKPSGDPFRKKPVNVACGSVVVGVCPAHVRNVPCFVNTHRMNHAEVRTVIGNQPVSLGKKLGVGQIVARIKPPGVHRGTVAGGKVLMFGGTVGSVSKSSHIQP